MIEKILFYHPLVTLPAAFSALQLTALALVLSKHKKAGLLRQSAWHQPYFYHCQSPVRLYSIRFKSATNGSNHQKTTSQRMQLLHLEAGSDPCLTPTQIGSLVKQATGWPAISLVNLDTPKAVISGGLPSLQTSKIPPTNLIRQDNCNSLWPQRRANNHKSCWAQYRGGGKLYWNTLDQKQLAQNDYRNKRLPHAEKPEKNLIFKRFITNSSTF